MAETKTNKKNRRLPKWLTPLLIVIVAVAFLVGYKLKGIIVATTVNGRPIYTWEFGSRLWQRYGQRTLDDLVLEKLVEEEAQKNNLLVSSEEIQKEIEKIQTEYGGAENLQSTLKNQGFSYDDFLDGIRLQLTVDKILSQKITISDEEINAFITQYGLQLEATEEAAQKQEAREIIRNQKLNEEYEKFFPDLKDQAKINQFVKF